MRFCCSLSRGVHELHVHGVVTLQKGPWSFIVLGASELNVTDMPGIPAGQQLLLTLGGRALEDCSTLSECNMKTRIVLRLVLRPDGSPPSGMTLMGYPTQGLSAIDFVDEIQAASRQGQGLQPCSSPGAWAPQHDFWLRLTMLLVSLPRKFALSCLSGWSLFRACGESVLHAC
jgi:hypothetical protein